jgi:adenosylhomocysteinase
VDVFVPSTGNRDIIMASHMAKMKDQAIVCNIGHFDNEIQVDRLNGWPGIERTTIKPQVDEIEFPDGKRIVLLAEGRLVNLAAAEGHPSAVMDMSFANQVLCAVYLAAGEHSLDNGVHTVPAEIDREVARLKLAAMHIAIDQLTEEQTRYLSSWQEGT